MMVLAILSPLLAFPLVLATQLLEKWAMEPTRPTSAPPRNARRDATPAAAPQVSVPVLTVVVGPKE